MTGCSLILCSYKQNIKLAGIVYVHPITKNRMDSTQAGSLRLFKSFGGGGGSMSGVAIVSSMWSNVNVDTGLRRERELMCNYWREYTDLGCLTKRFDNTHISAVDIINDMVHSPGIDLGLQKKRVDEGPGAKAPRPVSKMRKLFKFLQSLPSRFIGSKSLWAF